MKLIWEPKIICNYAGVYSESGLHEKTMEFGGNVRGLQINGDRPDCVQLDSLDFRTLLAMHLPTRNVYLTDIYKSLVAKKR